jgi:hypothetical protein
MAVASSRYRCPVNRDLRRYAVLAVVPLVLSLAACTDQEEPEVPEVPGATETPGGTDETAEPTEPAADPTDAINVPFECGEMLTAGRVVQILQTSLDGETQRVYNDEFLQDSGRTGRLTCRYGVPSGGSSPSPSPSPGGPAVEIAVSSYVDAETAAGRIDSTLGSTSRDVEPQTIGGTEGYLLIGDDEVTYVVAEGVRTYVITLRRGLVPDAAEVVVILELAAEILGGSAPSDT